MRAIHSVLLIALILVGNASAADWPTTTTTHIESNPWGTYKKIEFPKAELPRSGSSVDYNFLYIVTVHSLIYGDYQFARTAFCRIPLINIVSLTDYNASDIEGDTVYGPGHSSPRLKHNQIINKIIHGDQPLFSLCECDLLLIREEGQTSDVTANDQNTLSRYITILDTPPISVFEGEFWGKDLDEFHAYRWLNTPISTVYSDIRTPDEEHTYLLKAPFVSAWEHNKNGDGEVRDYILDLLLLRGYTHTIKITKSNETITSRQEHFGYLESPIDIDEIGIWRTDRSEKGQTDKFLCLPLIGPVWSTWRNQNETTSHWGIFPRLWIWATRIPKPQLS